VFELWSPSVNDSNSLLPPFVSPLSIEELHPFIDTVVGMVLVFGGLAVLGLVTSRISLSSRWIRVVVGLFGASLVVGGIDELAVAFLGVDVDDPFSLVEYITALGILSVALVALPWFFLRAVTAHRTIESLRGEIQVTGRMAEEVRAQQRELSQRYAASSNALAKTTAEAFRFEALVRSSKDAVIGVNEDGTIWHWNPAAEELCKRGAQEMLGQSLENVRVGPSGDLWKETKRINTLPYLKAQGEVPLVAGDGSVVPVWFSVSRLPEQSGGGFSIIARNMSDKKAVEEKISTALVEKEALLKEVHHRVKNNLQLICSLLRLQAKEAADEAGLRLFRKSEERIRSLALVHEKLYRSESLSTINFGGYLHDLVAQLVRSSSSSLAPIEVEYSVMDLQFPIDTAITCGLIVNELVTNSMKHAKSEGSVMRLRVGLQRQDEDVFISVWDNGTSPVAPNVIEDSVSLGLSLVRTLTRQLGGAVKVSQDEGVAFTVRLPATVLKPKEGAAHRIAA
jgi:PAS domain S-box-containing protein